MKLGKCISKAEDYCGEKNKLFCDTELTSELVAEPNLIDPKKGRFFLFKSTGVPNRVDGVSESEPPFLISLPTLQGCDEMRFQRRMAGRRGRLHHMFVVPPSGGFLEFGHL